MGREYLNPSAVHPLPWPYSHAIRVGGLLYIAGQVALNHKLEIVGRDDVQAQARQCWENIRQICEAAGGRASDVIQIVTYLKNMDDSDAVQEVRKRYFPDGRYPVATMVEVSRLGLPGLLLEVQVVAHIPASG